MSQCTLSKKMRPSSSRYFVFVFQEPHRISRSKISILGRKNGLDFPRIGLAVAKKQIRYAHDRNRIKRIIRESFRLRQSILPSMDFVVIPRSGLDKLDNGSVYVILEEMWHRYQQVYG